MDRSSRSRVSLGGPEADAASWTILLTRSARPLVGGEILYNAQPF